MRVVFVALGQEQLGISILSAVLKRAGHETRLVFDPALFHDRYYFDIPVLRDVFDRDNDTVARIAAEEPDLIAFSVLTFTYEWALDIARRAKQLTGAPVIFGGVHPSAVPEVCLENDCVDYVCVGEGEEPLLRLCDQLGGAPPDDGLRPPAPIANLWWRERDGHIVRGPAAAFVQDLDALPFWDKALWEDDLPIATSYLTMASRGCPYRCSFCFNNFFAKLPGRNRGKYVRQRSVANCIEELVEAKRRYGIEFVDFEDDIFTLDKAWMREFLSEYRREIGVPFSCLVHPRFMDHDMARWLADAGCVRVQMGVQSVDEDYKRLTLLRVEKDEALRRSLDAMSAAGLSMKLDHILGLPGEPLAAQPQAWELYKRYRPSRVNTYWLSYLPGTEMTREALDAGWITPAEVDNINRGKTRLFHYVDSWTRDEALAVYQKYDLLFRWLPLLPRRVADALHAERIPALPSGVANLLGFVADVTSAALHGDRETYIYARLYAHHLRKLIPAMLRERIGWRRAMPAPRPPRAVAAEETAAPRAAAGGLR